MNFTGLTGQQKLTYIAEIIIFNGLWLWIGYALVTRAAQ